ncbi:MAG TPA: prepilin-type N-terminal cleavage/methylation domain-containing protein [Humisphaera sp.]
MTRRSPAPVARRTVARPPAARGGFSLVEMLIAIGVILVLAAIGVVGMNMYSDRVATDTTKTSLANASALVKELETKGALNRLVGPTGLTPAASYQPTSTIASGSYAKLNSGDTGRTNYINNEYKTKVGPILMSVNAERMKALPQGTVMDPPSGTQRSATDPIVPCDGWGNPLVFVPPGGLTGVSVKGSATAITVTSTGVSGSPQNRSFWVSAGPDGNLQTGDDNVYSFQN